MMDSVNPAPATTPAKAQRVLVLQGGGALGSYQAGAYQALCHFDFEPEWVAGISIGAINAAIIAGNEPSKRVDRLKEFWEMVSSGTPWVPAPINKGDRARSLYNETSAALIATFGTPGFFTPRVPPSPLWPKGSPQAQSFYDTAPLRKTLERLVDFDRINDLKCRLSVGAVGVTTGNFKYFDNFEFKKLGKRIGPEHIMASGALPPGFPSIVIDSEYYWDVSIVSNTTLDCVLTMVNIKPLLLSIKCYRPRALLEWRLRPQYAPLLCAGHGNHQRPSDLPDRSLQCPRTVAGIDAGSRRAREGYPLLQPHADEYRQEPADSQCPKGGPRSDRQIARRSQGRSFGGAFAGGGERKHRHRGAFDLPK